MTTENVVLMKRAREALTGKWGIGAAISIVSSVMDGVFGLIPNKLLVVPANLLIISAPLSLGWAIFSLAIARKQESGFKQFFYGFRRFGIAWRTLVLMYLLIFVWALLLIIPAFIAAVAYSQTFFILADDDQIGPYDALKKSRDLMQGYKLKYVYLILRYLGLALLCILTLGIGFFWLSPYFMVGMAEFYEDVKSNRLTSSD